MSTHITANDEDIAQVVLLPGDPLRARHIAETFLDGAKCYSEVRGMLGYTGTYEGVRVSVQGTGMGIPSFSIYAHELLSDYQCKTLIRVGTCGALQDGVGLRDIVLAMSAATDSGFNRSTFSTVDFAPTASFELLLAAHANATRLGIQVHVGSVFTTDLFYRENADIVDCLADYGVLAVEMETAALYTLAAKFGARALSVLTVSDHMKTGEQTTQKEREQQFNDMIKLALTTACQ